MKSSDVCTNANHLLENIPIWARELQLRTGRAEDDTATVAETASIPPAECGSSIANGGCGHDIKVAMRETRPLVRQQICTPASSRINTETNFEQL
jgi:hypothetical protein